MNIKWIKELPLFSSLSDEELRILMGAFQERSYDAGLELFAEGDPGDSFALVLEGEIEIVKAAGTPDERLLAVVAAGGYLGEMSLFNMEGRRSASARARTPVRFLEMGRANFEGFLNRYPRLAFEFIREMSARLRSGEDAIIRDLQTKNRELSRAYQDLQAAQELLIEQEKLAHELEIARRIQAGLLPRALPTLPGRKLATHWKPAREVGGDFYDFIEFPDGRFGLVIGDVSGKGVPAALMMATTRSLYRAAAERLVYPGAVLEWVNDRLCPDMPRNMFVTCLYMLLNPVRGKLEIANAGHCLPCRCSPDGVSELQATGMPLGLLPGMRYEQIQSRLAPNEALLVYSDGVVESHSPTREIFGMRRLRDSLEERLGLPELNRPLNLIPHLLDVLEAFTGPDWDQEDDITLLSLEPQ